MGRKAYLRSFIVLTLLMIPFYTASAATTKIISSPQLHKYVVQVGVGAPIFVTDSDGKRLVISDIETDTLRQFSDQRLPIFHLGFDRIFYLHRFYNSSVSIGPHWYFQQISYKGRVYQFGLPLLNNYAYKLKNSINDILAEARWQTQFCDGLIRPFVIFGLGLGVISSKYDDYANPDIPGGEIHISDDQTNLAVEGGVGVDFSLSDHIDLGLRYVYLYNGDANLGPSTSGRGLVQSFKLNTDSNAFILNLGYKFS